MEKSKKILIVPVKPVRQTNLYECGLASVMTIMRTMGARPNRESLKRKLGTSRKHGTHPENIKAYLDKIGVSYREKHGSSLVDIEKKLKRRKLCLVVYQAWGEQKYYDLLESGHYSVIFGVEKDYLWLADPNVRSKKARYGKGVRKIRKDLFEKRWKDVDCYGNLYDRWMLAV